MTNYTWEFRGRCKLTGVGTLGCHIVAPNQITVEVLYLEITPTTEFAAIRTFNLRFANLNNIYFVRGKELKLTTDVLTFPNRDDLASWETPERMMVHYPDNIDIIVNSNTLNEEFNLEIKAVISGHAEPTIIGKNENTITTLGSILGGIE